ncbi:hypothetical protein JRO89_XS14G0177200 [Xanthoceras sorbifolium]|uniref:Reverse transcriptase RNase H-like domain-containing protein n=1 Tax=Xanthoceras sorbifolium TaxID=99658 RepID=A0ABQ8H5J1_9ROSI|nr:hypothetical protein JRO89_XS14G0177200 [Xanthoceras sorbifolium]
MTPVANCIRDGKFLWSADANNAFELLKRKLTTAPILVLLDFSLTFELHSDALTVGIDAILIVQAIKYCRHYLFHKEFVIYTDHDALKPLGSQDKHQSRSSNRVADALSRRHSLIATLSVSYSRFLKLTGYTPSDLFFSWIFDDVQSGVRSDYLMNVDFLFLGNQLCIPDCSLWLQIIKELQGEGLVGRDRALHLVAISYFWPMLHRVIERYVERCRVFQTSKDHIKPWDAKLSQAEFAHNHAKNRSTNFSPFQVIYGYVPQCPFDLTPLPDRTRIHGKAAKFIENL